MLYTIHGKAHRSAEYGALFLVTSGAYSAMPVIVCWFAMNLGGHHRRSVGSAWQIGFGNIGGIIATYSFLAKDAPFLEPKSTSAIMSASKSAAVFSPQPT